MNRPADPTADFPGELTFTSDYLTDGFYEELVQLVASGRTLGRSTEPAVRAECESLLFHEARLLDEHRYGEWLSLLTRQCIYWIPFDDRADPRTHVNLVFDDRRRLEDRVLRLRSGHAHTLKPGRRFQHAVCAVEAWTLAPGRRRALASQAVYEYRSGGPIARHLFRSDHLLVEEQGEWRIALKRCVLLNQDDAFEPPTLL